MIDLSSYQNKSTEDRRRCSFHFVFVPKYRRRVFVNEDKRFMLKEFLKKICEKYAIGIHALEVAPDHVHLFAELPISMSVSYAIRLLKSRSAKLMFQAFPNYRKLYPKGHFWNGYAYYESIGRVTASKIEKYIRESQSKHMHGK